MKDNALTHSVSVRVPVTLHKEMLELLESIEPPTSMNLLAVYLIKKGLQFNNFEEAVRQAVKVIEDKGYAEDEFDILVDWVNGK